ncbi:ROK family protein [Fulvitalea axinellae]
MANHIEFLGVDLGGTNIKIGVVDTEGNLLDKVKYPTAPLQESGDFITNFIEILGSELSKRPHISKVGIGVPGTLTKCRRTTLEFPNIKGLGGQPLMDKLEDAFPEKEIWLENDANAAALGELYFSRSPRPDHFIFVTLGTGVGGAVIMDREIFKGGDGNALEIGHVMVSNGMTLEQNFGKKGMVAYAQKLIDSGKYETGLISEDLYPKAIVKALPKGDVVAKKVFRKNAKYLGEALVGAVRLLDIKDIFIGGGVAASFPYFEAELMAYLREHLTEYYTISLSVRRAELGNNAGILGAASLCFQQGEKN